jgi:drug/metabolite transporter (DMT)-like permease
VFGLGGAVLFLDESIGMLQASGALMIVAAVAFAKRGADA